MMNRSAKIPIAALFAAVSAVLLTGCGDYSGGGGQSSGQGTVVVGSATGGLSSGQQVTAFQATVQPLLTEHCGSCHSGSGPGTPHIAHADAATAYSAVVDNQKVNLNLPDASRIVRRLATDFHYCWSGCIENGAEMLAQVNAWAFALEQAGVDGSSSAGVAVETLTSDTLRLEDGIEDEGETRYEAGIIARFEFKTGSGEVAFDTSGVAPPMDLSLTGVRWMSNYGLEFDSNGSGFALAAQETSTKLYERIADPDEGSGEYTVEAWVIPANTTQQGDSGPSRIVTYARGTGNANFTVGQRLYTYAVRNRMTADGVSNRGEPELVTYPADEDLQDTLQHVVVTFERFTGRRIYVDGKFTDDVDEQPTGRLWNWDERARFELGNQHNSSGNDWLGRVRFVAIYDRALTTEQIRQNYQAGVGKRVTMTFDLAEWAGVGTTIDFSVQQIDEYAYLFCQPTIHGPNVAGLHVEDIRIEVNGTVPVAGQGFSNIDATISEDGQQISRQCSIIRTELGPDLDSFRVAFEELGRFESPIAVSKPSYAVSTAVLADVPSLGMRDFSRVNMTMAELTGVDPTTPMVAETYAGLTEQLPSTSDVRSFVSSHQVGISKLAFEYCHEMVEGDLGLRDSFFGVGFEFDQVPAVAFGTSLKTDLITGALIAKMLRRGDVSQELADQADSAMAASDLDLLIAELSTCNLSACDADRTVNIVKGACTAVLASAGVMVH